MEDVTRTPRRELVTALFFMVLINVFWGTSFPLVKTWTEVSSEAAALNACPPAVSAEANVAMNAPRYWAADDASNHIAIIVDSSAGGTTPPL